MYYINDLKSIPLYFSPKVSISKILRSGFSSDLEKDIFIYSLGITSSISSPHSNRQIPFEKYSSPPIFSNSYISPNL